MNLDKGCKRIVTAGNPQYARYEGTAPDDVWAGVVELFVSTFSAPPYNESLRDLAEIGRWGRVQLADVGGRLVTATHDARVIGMSLAHRLDADGAWQTLLPAIATAHELPVDEPERIVVVHELAVDVSYRRTGIGKECLVQQLQHRPETRAVLGVYAQARSARSMYQRWGF